LALVKIKVAVAAAGLISSAEDRYAPTARSRVAWAMGMSMRYIAFASNDD
jgi:hypothetical protein